MSAARATPVGEDLTVRSAIGNAVAALSGANDRAVFFVWAAADMPFTA
jgi:hypothetical protein